MNSQLHTAIESLWPFRDKPVSAPVPRRIALYSNEHWKAPARACVASIRCVRGTVWITTEGELEDVILSAGDEWQPGRRKLTVVGALSDSELCISGN
jgi:hypothetical protein